MPRGSQVKGRIIISHNPSYPLLKYLELKFESIAIPASPDLAFVAHVVSRGGAVNIRRGFKGIVYSSSKPIPPVLPGDHLSSCWSRKGDKLSNLSQLSNLEEKAKALSSGWQSRAIVLSQKDGHSIALRPGDELMIELEEDLRVPMGNYARSYSDLTTDVTLPAGSRLVITLDAALNSDSIYHGDEFGATLSAISGSTKRPEPEKIEGRLIVSDLEKFCWHKLLVLKLDSAGKSSILSANVVTGTVIKNRPKVRRIRLPDLSCSSPIQQL